KLIVVVPSGTRIGYGQGSHDFWTSIAHLSPSSSIRSGMSVKRRIDPEPSTRRTVRVPAAIITPDDARRRSCVKVKVIDPDFGASSANSVTPKVTRRDWTVGTKAGIDI